MNELIYWFIVGAILITILLNYEKVFVFLKLSKKEDFQESKGEQSK